MTEQDVLDHLRLGNMDENMSDVAVEVIRLMEWARRKHAGVELIDWRVIQDDGHGRTVNERTTRMVYSPLSLPDPDWTPE